MYDKDAMQGWSYFLLYSSHSSIGPSFIELCRRVVKPRAYTARNGDINLYRGYIGRAALVRTSPQITPNE